MNPFETLGFSWERQLMPRVVPKHSVERTSFHLHRSIPEFTWDTCVLEGSPYTFVEVKTLLDGITVGGRRVSDQARILDMAASAKRLLARVKTGAFALNWDTFVDLHRGREEPRPMPRNPTFDAGVEALTQLVSHPPERAIAFYLFGVLHRFLPDRNERASRFMMNGLLTSHGIDAISVPASRIDAFRQAMARFRERREGTESMALLIDYHSDAVAIRASISNELRQ